jgi:hypothetical protein
MKHTHAAEDYVNRSYQEIEAVFTKFNLILLILILKLRRAVQWTV